MGCDGTRSAVRRSAGITFPGTDASMAAVLRLVGEGAVRPPVIDRTYRLNEAAAAHRRLEDGTGVGKVVLTHG